MTLTLRYMHPNDVLQVVAIDEASFPDAWSMRSYLFEVNESKVSHMVVLEDSVATVGTALTKPQNRFERFIDRLMGRSEPVPTPPNKPIVAYGGMWHIADETHISTIATHPNYRGKHYGEIVLAGMVKKAIAVQAAYVVLEVRVSNAVAQSLYLKYGFVTVNTNKSYYRDGEDAYDMRLELHESKTIEQLTDLYQAIQKQTGFVDEYTTAPHPRLR